MGCQWARVTRTRITTPVVNARWWDLKAKFVVSLDVTWLNKGREPGQTSSRGVWTVLMLIRMVETQKENLRRHGSEFFIMLRNQTAHRRDCSWKENWNLLVLVKALNERLKPRAESQDRVMSFTNIQRFKSQPSKHVVPPALWGVLWKLMKLVQEDKTTD